MPDVCLPKLVSDGVILAGAGIKSESDLLSRVPSSSWDEVFNISANAFFNHRHLKDAPSAPSHVKKGREKAFRAKDLLVQKARIFSDNPPQEEIRIVIVPKPLSEIEKLKKENERLRQLLSRKEDSQFVVIGMDENVY